MTREEAVNELNDRIKSAEYVDSDYIDCVSVDAVKIAISALSVPETNVGDTISRQAAIDALKAKAVPLYKDPGCNDIWERDRTLDNAIDVIRGLPSAEPEVIRCKDCAHYNAGFECLIEGYGIERNPNWFCADGERRTDETD